MDVHTVFKILLIVPIFGFLIGIHEFGHFLLAKLNGIRVDEFSIGMGPTLIKKKIGETTYMLKLFWIGGFVSILGEDPTPPRLVDDSGRKLPLDEMTKLYKQGVLKNELDENAYRKMARYFQSLTDKRSFLNKSGWRKITVLLAGVFMNFMTAVVIYYFLLASAGFVYALPSIMVPDYQPWFGEKYSKGVLYETVPEGNAAQDGLPEIGYIVDIDGVPAVSFETVKKTISQSEGTVQIRVCDSVMPEIGCSIYETHVNDEYAIGVRLYATADFIRYTGVNKVLAGFEHPLNYLKLAYQGFTSAWHRARQTGDYTEVRANAGGPILLAQVLTYMQTPREILELVAAVSLSLAVMNLLPIPALDGGRVLLVLISMIMRRPINGRVEGWLIKGSFVLLLVLMAAVFFKDIVFFGDIKTLLG